MAKVLIVEDEALIADDISATLQEAGHEVVGIADDYHSALALLNADRSELVLLDIKLKGEKDGIALASDIKQKYKIPLIYLSSNTESATLKKAFETSPQAFLTKPFNEKDLMIAIELALHSGKDTVKDINVIDDAIFIKKNDRYIKVPFGDILFVEAERSYCKVHTRLGKHLLSINSQKFHEVLDSRVFIRVHRSYVVNVNNIDSFNADYVFIVDEKIPISKSYQADFMQLLRKA